MLFVMSKVWLQHLTGACKVMFVYSLPKFHPMKIDQKIKRSNRMRYNNFYTS